MAEDVKSTELDVLMAGSEVEVRGEKVQIKPYNWVTTIKMADPFRTVVQAVVNNSDRVAGITNVQDTTSTQQIFAVLGIVADLEDADKIIDAVTTLIASSIGKDKEYVQELDIDEVIELGIEVFKVNRDFFGQKMQKLAKLMPEKEGLKNEKSPRTKSSKN